MGPDAVRDRVVGTGDVLGGLIVRSLRICEGGLNDHGELAFLATFDDPRVPDGVRIGVYRATPRSARRLAAGGRRRHRPWLATARR